jgi:putative acetyltransferase
MGLGELAVLAECPRHGIGTRLGEAGLAALRAAGCPFCIVVGHASYYPRFGFEPGSRRGLACQWPKVPDASFMVAVLDEAAMRGMTGIARFRDVD